MFGPGISDALPYDTMAQAPYPPPAADPTDDLAATPKATASEIISVPSLLSFLASKQWKTLGSLSEGIRYPSASLIQSYIEEGIPTYTKHPWYPQALETAISKVPHASS